MRKEQQGVWDFALLVCHSIPALKKTIKGVTCGIANYGIPNPDYFSAPESCDRLTMLAANYKVNLSRYLLLSLYSYFESYISSSVDEIIKFHGGTTQIIDKASYIHDKHMIAFSSSQLVKHKRKLQEYPKCGKEQKYRKNEDVLLCDANYRGPTEQFAVFGLLKFTEEFSGDAMISSRIPTFLEQVLRIDMTQKLNSHADLIDFDIHQTLESCRKCRNNIAHGEKTKISLPIVVGYSNFIKKISKQVNECLVNNFLVLQGIA